MATISRTGIAGGGTISPAHITNIIDALDGSSSTTTVVASGSFTGSLVGTLTGTASFATQALSASYAANVPSTASYALTALSASYATTASFALNAGGGGSSFPFTGSAIVSGSLLVTGSLNVSGSARVVGTTTLTGSINVSQSAGVHSVDGTIIGSNNLVLNLKDVGKTPSAGSFVIPNFQPGTPLEGAIYWDPSARTLNVYSVASGWTVFIA
jgi:hypothetical protein